MTRRTFLAALAAQADRPNIVYVLADDLGWGDLRCYNAASAVATPNADRLAREGMRFTDMHSPSSVCTPTRYGILTGRYCWRTSLKRGVLWGYSPNLIEPGRLTAASLLKSAGYATGGVGKWHLGLGTGEKTDYSKPLQPSPLDHGFEYFFGIPASLDIDPYLYFENDRVVEAASAETPGSDTPRGIFWRKGAIAPSFKLENVLPELIDKAVAFVRRDHKKPYFLYLPLTAPHTPWMPHEKGRTGGGTYTDFVAMVDQMLGRVMEAIGTSNTLLIFTSDNGAAWREEDKAKFAHRANAGWRGQKADIWEAGHRIPFLARWPGRIPAGRVQNTLGCLTDFMATVADIAGVALPRDAGEDSYSLLPALRGKAGSRRAIVHHSGDGMFSIREGSWKLALGLGSGGFSQPQRIPGPGGQLYDLSKDPGETNNLYDRRADVVARLTKLLERYQQQGYSRPI
ncbi:MAG: hypothetical protein FJW30_16770 [Acidobacteria bacterium]|nr:hypothetical protein [Acidobacteriota bacterium]